MFTGILSASGERISRQTIYRTARSLQTRILGNMVQNAVEASRPDEPVRISCKVQNGEVEFQVHNECYKGISPILGTTPQGLFRWLIPHRGG